MPGAPRLLVHVTYYPDRWPMAYDGGRAPHRGAFCAWVDGLPGCEGSSDTVRGAVELLASELMARVDAEDYRVYLDADDPETVEAVVARLGRAGELIDALIDAAEEPVLVGDLDSLRDRGSEPGGSDTETGMTSTALRGGLLDVVPWSFGFAHSFALRWLFLDERQSPRLMTALGKDGTVVSAEAERAGGRGRADLVVHLDDGSQFEVETKVNDWVDQNQMSSYGAGVVLYLPGLTGMMLAGDHLKLEGTKLTGSQLLDAVERDAELPELIAGYLAVLENEATRMAAAREIVRGPAGPAELPEPTPGLGLPDGEHLADVAWITEMAAQLASRGGAFGLDAEIWPRLTANDRGFKWDVAPASYRGTDQSWIWIDVLVPFRTHQREIRVKANGPLMTELWGHAASAGPDVDGWTVGRRLTRAATATIGWVKVGNDRTLEDAVEAALAIGVWARDLAANRDGSPPAGQ